MNIFVTNPCPIQSAHALDDKRVIKMILESAQMMATAISYAGGVTPYKPTHRNHPCSVWIRENSSNYSWALKHFEALCQAYYDRFGKRHKCLDHHSIWQDGANLMAKGDLTPFANCTEFKNIEDVHQAYKLQMNKKWKEDKRAPKWTKSNPPGWTNG